MLRRMIPAPGSFQGLELGERVTEHSRYVRDLLHKHHFDLLDKLWARKFWSWAGHISRLPPTYPSSMWNSFRDQAWWKLEQTKAQGLRHKWYDANISRWERPLLAHTPWGKQWKTQAKNRERWQKYFEVFWISLNAVWHRNPQTRTDRSKTPQAQKSLEAARREKQEGRLGKGKLETRKTVG